MSEENNINLEQLYNQSIKKLNDGQIVEGRIVAIKTKEVLIDVGFKSEGVVPITEFTPDELQMDKKLNFFIESIENDAGMITLSHTRANQLQGWNNVVDSFKSGKLVEGKINGVYLRDSNLKKDYNDFACSIMQGIKRLSREKGGG